MKVQLNNQFFTDNSNEVDQNTIFVYNHENEKFIEDAKQNNAQDIIKSNELKNYVNNSSIQIVGITGTNGKTTTAAALYSILLDLGYKVALQGTRGFFINDQRVEEYSLTTPVQLANFAHIQEAIYQKCDFFIMEVSSHAIVQKRVEGLKFALKIHTNITQDHLDYHKTLQEYIDVKNSFFKDDTPKLINKDDPKVRFSRKNGFAYGLDNPATYKVQAYSFQNGVHIVLQHFNEIFNFSSNLYGLFNIYNIVAAFSAAHILTKKPFDQIAAAVENFAGVSGRMEVVSNDPLVIVDFAHTPDGMAQVLNALKEKELLVVFGAGGDRDKTKRPIMGRIAASLAKKVYITSDNPRTEDPDAIVSDILSGISDKRDIVVELDRKKAIQLALDEQENDEVVVILGKGDETYQIVYDKKFPFDDREIVRELLNI
jgi:UDP-N-acetylmuramoyl-L-alanyl-D-glutamate--2,6-diaminopimelate ligase